LFLQKTDEKMTLFKKFTTWAGSTATKALQTASDVALGVIEQPLNTVGLGNVIPDSAYSSKISAQAANMTFAAHDKVSNAILSKVAPGVGSVTSAAQKNNPYNQRSVVQNPGTQFDISTSQTSNAQTLLEQQLLQAQEKKKQDEEASIEEKQKQKETFIILGVVGAVLIVLVLGFWDNK
jgi:hypothetical protein